MMSETLETPTQAIIASSQPPEVTLDATGRKIVVRVLSPVEQFRFKKVVGTFMGNPGYMLDAMMAASVRNIDGNPMPFPQSEANVEFILEKLGWDAWQAVQTHYSKLAEDRTAEIADVKN
jgi:hypothetical protein